MTFTVVAGAPFQASSSVPSSAGAAAAFFATSTFFCCAAAVGANSAITNAARISGSTIDLHERCVVIIVLLRRRLRRFVASHSVTHSHWLAQQHDPHDRERER